MISSVSPQGQVTIPKRIRDALLLSPGDQILFSYEGDVVMFRKVNSDELCDLVRRNASTREASSEAPESTRIEPGNTGV